MALALRLLLQGLGGRYPALLSGSCLFALRSTLLITAMGHGPSFSRQLWKYTEPLEWLVCAWVVFELFGHWTRNYPGIGRFGRLLLGVFTFLAGLASVAISPMEWKALIFAGDRAKFYLVYRVVVVALALFTIAIWLFFSNYPAPVSPNIRYHTRILVAYLVSVAFALLALNFLGDRLGTRQFAWTNLLIVMSTVGCFGMWAILMTRKGEVKAGGPEPLRPEQKAAIERINLQLLDFMKGLRPAGRRSS